MDMFVIDDYPHEQVRESQGESQADGKDGIGVLRYWRV
jgi:hypothetical protein